jgi:hypothetical protein
MAVFAYALYVTQRTESGFDDSGETRPLSLSDSIFTAIGVICQEGLSFSKVVLIINTKNVVRFVGGT